MNYEEELHRKKLRRKDDRVNMRENVRGRSNLIAEGWNLVVLHVVAIEGFLKRQAGLEQARYQGFENRNSWDMVPVWCGLV